MNPKLSSLGVMLVQAVSQSRNNVVAVLPYVADAKDVDLFELGDELASLRRALETLEKKCAREMERRTKK